MVINILNGDLEIRSEKSVGRMALPVFQQAPDQQSK